MENPDLIMIIVRDQDPLTVNRDILIRSGPVFDNFINELLLTEIEMDDFEFDHVAQFLALLDTPSLSFSYSNNIEEIGGPIDTKNFRELHKMSIVFQVNRLIMFLHDYFQKRIIRLSYACHSSHIETGEFVKEMKFVMEESKFMFNKWGNNFLEFIHLFSKVARDLPIHLTKAFLDESIRDLNSLTKFDATTLLIIARPTQMDIFLTRILKEMEENKILGDKLILLFEKINLALSQVRFPELYEQILHYLKSNIEVKSLKDMKFIFEVVNHNAHKRVFPRKSLKSVYDAKGFEWFMDGVFIGQKFKMLFVAEHKHVRSMNTVVDYISYVLLTFTEDELPDIEILDVLEQLKGISFKRNLNKADRSYVERLITTLICLLGEVSGRRKPIFELLKNIASNSYLSDDFDNELIYCDKETDDEALMFYFRHPGVPDCERSGRCGFILQRGSFTNSLTDKEGHFIKFHREDKWSSKKSKDRVHCHDLISAEEMSLLYTEFEASKGEKAYGTRCVLPLPLFEILHSVPKLKMDTFKQLNDRKFVIYNISYYRPLKRYISQDFISDENSDKAEKEERIDEDELSALFLQSTQLEMT